MEKVQLRKGGTTEYPDYIKQVVESMRILKEFYTDSFVELVTKCRNTEHKISEKAMSAISSMGLGDGGASREIPEQVRNIVLSATEDDGWAMVSPI